MSATDELRSMAESVGLAVLQAATLMMGAADTIDRLESENYKLRELVRGLVYATHPADRARLIADAAEFGIEVWKRMRELGVEVDG